MDTMCPYRSVKEWVTLEKHFGNEVKFHEMLSQLDYSWARDIERQAGVAIAHPRVLYATESLIVEEEIQGVPVLSLASKPQPITIEDVIDAGYTRGEAEEVFNRLNVLEPREAHIVLSLKKAGFPDRSLDGVTRKMLAYDYEKLRDLLRNMLLRQIFIDGIFHADLHQGNVLVTPDGRLVMIDRGNVGTLNREQIEGAKILLKGLLLREKELIKQGIDQIFLHATYPEGVEPINSSITLDEIQEVLDKEFDLKMTMNIISVRAVQGSKNTPGGKDFSTFLKAFTQAMYLFPTDLSNGMVTLQAIAKYISMNEEEARRAAQEQAKYVVIKEVSTTREQAQEGDFTQIVKRRFYEKTDRYFLRSVWRPILFRILMIPVKRALPRVSAMRNNIMGLARVYGRQFIEEHLDQFIEKQNLEISEAVRDIISVSYAEKFLTNYVNQSLRKRFLGRLTAPVVMPLFKGVLFLVRPFTRTLIEAAQEWIGTTGKRYIAGIAPQMTVKEGVGLLSQVFVEDFENIRRKFDERNTGARLATSPESSFGARSTGFQNIGLNQNQIFPVISQRNPEDPSKIQALYEIEGLLPTRPIKNAKDIDPLLRDSLPLITATQHQGALLYVSGAVPVTFVGINVLQKTSGSTTIGVGEELDQVQITREDVQKAGSRLAAIAVRELPKVEIKTEPQEIAVEVYQEQDKRTAQLFRQMVNRLTENKSAIFRFYVSDEDQSIVDNIAKEMTEFKAELDRLNQGAAFVFKARFELTNKEGDVIQTLETTQQMTEEEAAGAAQFYSSVENQAFLDEAKAVKAGYLPTEGIHVGEEVRVFNYKAIGRTGLSVVTDSPSAPQMIEALTGADMGRTDVARTNLQLVKSPNIPLNGEIVSIQTYRKQNLIVRALAKLAQQLYQAYVTLRAAGTSA